MKRFHALLHLALLATPAATSSACDVCRAQQPSLISEFTHGSGPSGPGDFTLPALMLLVMIYSCFRAWQCFRKPADHPYQAAKHSILALPSK